MSPGHKKMIWFAFDESRDILGREGRKEGVKVRGREGIGTPACRLADLVLGG